MKTIIKISILALIFTLAFFVTVKAIDETEEDEDVVPATLATEEEVTVEDLDLTPNLLDDEEDENQIIDDEDEVEDEDDINTPSRNLAVTNTTPQTVVTTTTNDNVLSLSNILSITIIVIGIILIFLGIAILIRCKS